MEKDDITNSRLIKNLKKLGYDYSLLPAKQQEYLQQVDEAINTLFETELKAQEETSRNYISIKRVSKETNIARQTFYNIPILAEYIEQCSRDFDKVDISYRLRRAQQKNIEYQEQIQEMVKRDVEFMELKRENSKIKEELEWKNKMLKSKNLYN